MYVQYSYYCTASEVVIHGEPSGLDNTTSCFGGAVRLNRTLGMHFFLRLVLCAKVVSKRYPRSQI